MKLTKVFGNFWWDNSAEESHMVRIISLSKFFCFFAQWNHSNVWSRMKRKIIMSFTLFFQILSKSSNPIKFLYIKHKMFSPDWSAVLGLWLWCVSMSDTIVPSSNCEIFFVSKLFLRLKQFSWTKILTIFLGLEWVAV